MFATRRRMAVRAARRTQSLAARLDDVRFVRERLEDLRNGTQAD
jgi:hypothetical protein